MTYPIPNASVAARNASRNEPNQNPGLIFERFVPKDPEKQTFLEEVVAASNRIDSDLLNAHVAIWKETVGAFDATIIEMETTGRFITGIGINNPVEVGFLFNQYGFPYLPGSSVKGLTRAWILDELIEKTANKDINSLAETLEDLEPYDVLRKLLEKDDSTQAWDNLKTYFPSLFKTGSYRELIVFRNIFGSQTGIGDAIFFDAIPSDTFQLEVDLMTPHYPKYYSGEGLPSDTDGPIIIPFLTVAKGTKFLFAIGWKKQPTKPVRKLVPGWLQKGLENFGAGAKTHAGYGSFKPING